MEQRLGDYSGMLSRANRTLIVLALLFFACAERKKLFRITSQGYQCFTVDAQQVRDVARNQKFPIYKGTQPPLEWTRDLYLQYHADPQYKLCLVVQPGTMRAALMELTAFYKQHWLFELDMDKPDVFTLDPGGPCQLNKGPCQIREKYPPDLYRTETESRVLAKVQLLFTQAGRALTVHVPVIPGNHTIRRWQNLPIDETAGAGWPSDPDRWPEDYAAGKESLLLFWQLSEETPP